MSDERIISIRLPEAVLTLIDATVEAGLYKNRTEVLREAIRSGMNTLLYRGCGGFCLDLRKIVDCCHDDKCKYNQKCKIYTEV